MVGIVDDVAKALRLAGNMNIEKIEKVGVCIVVKLDTDETFTLRVEEGDTSGG